MLKKGCIIISLLLTMFLSIGSVSFALATCGDNNSSYNYQDKVTESCPPTFNQLSGVVTALVEAILAIAAVVFFFMLVVNGFNFITAVGDTEKIGNARKGLLFTVIGFALLFGSFVALSIIAHVVGIKTGFSVSSNGQIQFNVISTFTPTPLPTDQVNQNGSTSTP